MKLEVQEGYIFDEGFSTRYNEYAERVEELPKDVEATDEERQQYLDGDLDVVYRTADGKIFADYEKSKVYQKKLKLPELEEVLEALEKIKFLCEKNKKSSPLLGAIGSAVAKLATGEGDELMDKYYDSTC